VPKRPAASFVASWAVRTVDFLAFWIRCYQEHSAPAANWKGGSHRHFVEDYVGTHHSVPRLQRSLVERIAG
jgi:hypothetical protein